ncbi:MAG: hypothetical protein KDC54_07845, partial [Lewinella sp.]|nr:hypothetical protein [Lewinella sp.]
MNRLMYFLFALLLAMLTGCFEPEPGPLVFFGVKTNPAEIVPGGLLGQVRLSGQLQDILADEVDEIADYGFRWSADRTALEQQQGAITTLSLGPYQGGATTFDTLSPPMEPDRIYYFQAYAIGYEVDWETGERREVYGEIESTTLEIQLQLDYTHRTNDVAFLRLMITGLNARNAKAENVYLLFGPDSTITSAMAYPYGPVTSDTVVLDTFPELAFNTTYYAQAVLDASQDYRGDWVPVAITDGWREVT